MSWLYNRRLQTALPYLLCPRDWHGYGSHSAASISSRREQSFQRQTQQGRVGQFSGRGKFVLVLQKGELSGSLLSIHCLDAHAFDTGLSAEGRQGSGMGAREGGRRLARYRQVPHQSTARQWRSYPGGSADPCRIGWPMGVCGSCHKNELYLFEVSLLVPLPLFKRQRARATLFFFFVPHVRWSLFCVEFL